MQTNMRAIPLTSTKTNITVCKDHVHSNGIFVGSRGLNVSYRRAAWRHPVRTISLPTRQHIKVLAEDGHVHS